jgi:hypothetical protein
MNISGGYPEKFLKNLFLVPRTDSRAIVAHHYDNLVIFNGCDQGDV